MFERGQRRAGHRDLDQRLAPAVVLLPGRREHGRRGVEPDRSGRGGAVDASRSATRSRSPGRSRARCSSRRRRRTRRCSCSCSTVDRTGRCSTSTAACCGRATAQIDEDESQKTADGQIYRPCRPARDARRTSRRARMTEYLIDIFPVGHVFLPGPRAGREGPRTAARRQRLQLHRRRRCPGQHTLHFGRPRHG